MSTPQGRPGPGANRLLAILPPSSRQRLLALAKPVPLPTGQVLMRERAHIEHVYFPLRGIISLVVVMGDGRGVDAATIGFEGMVGAPVVLGEERSPYETTVQLAGEALQVPTEAFRALVNEDAALRDVALRYTHVLLVQAARTAACNRLHVVEQRLARWLLHTHDWVCEDRFRLTQEFLAIMLGVRRATVTVAAGTLQQVGLLTYHRGEITVLDRSGLEAVACEGYQVIRDAFERLLALPPSR